MKQLKSPRFCYSGIIFSHIVCRQINIRRYNAHVVNISFKVIKNATSGNALVKLHGSHEWPEGGGGSLVNLNFVNLHSEIPKTCLVLYFPCLTYTCNIYIPRTSLPRENFSASAHARSFIFGAWILHFRV